MLVYINIGMMKDIFLRLFIVLEGDIFDDFLDVIGE